MRIYILTTTEPLSDILLAGWMKKYHEHIAGIFVEKQKSLFWPLKILWKLKQKTSWHFALYIGFERIYLKLVLLIKKFFGIRKLDDFYKIAKEQSIPIEYIEDFNSPDFIKKYKQLKPDLVILVRISFIVKRRLLRVPRLGTINLHPARLPAYKGRLPIFQALAHNEEVIGNTIHVVTPDIDGGEIIAQNQISIVPGKSLTYHSLHIFLSGRVLLEKTVGEIIKHGTIKSTPQNDRNATYFSWPSRMDLKRFRKTRCKFMTAKDLWRIWCKL